MAFDPNGETGLRRRLKTACTPPSSVNEVSQVLGVSADILSNYTTNPEYVLTNETITQILANLPNVPPREFSVRGNQGFSYIRYEKPQWTQDDIDDLVPPRGAVSVAIYFYQPTYSDDVETDGPNDLDTFTVQQVIEDATDGDPDLLMSVVWYVPYVTYNY